jgi:beta-carotene hydroxylase
MTMAQEATAAAAGERPTAEELAVVRRHVGGFGWPTVVLCAALVAVDVVTVAAVVRGALPVPLGTAIASLVAYASYTVHHDATHKAISGRSPRWRWVEVACGTVAAAALGLEFRGYAANHLRHHANTNDPADPDLLVKGPLWQVPLKWAVLMVLVTIGALPYGDHLVRAVLRRLVPTFAEPASERDRADARRLRRWSQLSLAVLLATVPFGGFPVALALWWLPSRLGILLLMVLFQWLPHFPFDRTDRFGATRVNRFPGSTWLLLQQDRHLVHHLYPSIPWYRYRAAYRELRPLLEANGAIIEGIGTAPHVPIRLRTPVAAAG